VKPDGILHFYKVGYILKKDINKWYPVYDLYNLNNTYFNFSKKYSTFNLNNSLR